MEGNNPTIPAEASLQIQHDTQFDLHTLRTALGVKSSKSQCSGLRWPSEHSGHAEGRGGLSAGHQCLHERKVPLGGCLLFPLYFTLCSTSGHDLPGGFPHPLMVHSPQFKSNAAEEGHGGSRPSGTAGWPDTPQPCPLLMSISPLT